MIIAANFKCNKTRAEFKEYAKKLNDFLKDNKTNARVYVAPSFTSFCEGEFNFTQTSQNIYPVKNGAYTGEIGLSHLEEFNIKSVILGHCERRALGESDDFLVQKFNFCKEHNLEIIFCIGEDTHVYENKKTLEFLKAQLANIDLNYEKLILAYEPIYSIGKKAAKLEDIKQVVEYLKTLTKQPILYGGSVNDENFKDIKKLCDGVLIGSASLDIDNFINIIKKI